MEPPSHLDTEIEVAEIKSSNLLDLRSHEAYMRDALKSYKQFIANAPAINDSNVNKAQEDNMKRILAWRAQGAIASQALETHAKALQTKLMETVHQSDRDKELASINVDGLQKLINELNVERDQLSESVKELDTAQGVDSNLKMEYRSQHVQYIVYFIITIIIVVILFRIQTSQKSGAMELMILIASIIFMFYHFSDWIKAIATGLRHWLNGLFNF